MRHFSMAFVSVSFDALRLPRLDARLPVEDPERGERSGCRPRRDPPRPGPRGRRRGGRRGLLAFDFHDFLRTELGNDPPHDRVERGDDELAELQVLLLEEDLDGRRDGGRRFRCGGLRGTADGLERGRLAVAPVRQEPELVKRLRDVDRADRLGQHADGARGARLAAVDLAFLRGVHHDRDVGEPGIGLDLAHRLQAVHARHEVVHEDHVRPAVLQVLERGLR
jgi:hypothetical protein